MSSLFNKTGLPVSCLAISVLVHILFLYAVRMYGPYDITLPVMHSQSFGVDLIKPIHKPPSAAGTGKPLKRDMNQVREDETVEQYSSLVNDKRNSTLPANIEPLRPGPPDSHAVQADKIGYSVDRDQAAKVNSAGESLQPAVTDPGQSPLKTVGEFLAKKNERLTYLVSMFGVPVGSAELESWNEQGEIWITLRVKTNNVLSSIFPVDNIIEARHIDGKYILAKIKQHEGAFRSDEEFTINQRKKKVLWIDNIGNRSVKTTIPNDEVLDTLSGIYYLRARQLEIGKTETLHIFDSEAYAAVPVEVLRRETVRLLNFREVDTLVVRPLQMTAGIFRRTGDILIWMTSDDYKVPVKIVTSIALGTVTAELVSSESESGEEKVKNR